MLRVKNLTPYYYASKVTSRTPPQPEISFVVKASYKIVVGGVCEPMGEFDQPFVTGDVFAEGDDERRGALSYPSDIADFKPNGELILRASAYAPGGSANSCLVKAEVGRWSKELLVVGPRVWKHHDPSAATRILKKAVKAMSGAEVTSEATPPVAFSAVPLTLSNAFGGPDYAANPVGQGHHTEYLPQVEYQNDPVKSPQSKVYPATFAGISPNWAERAAKFGKQYGKSYQEQGRAPWYAEDMDWTYFNAAPHDQQIEGYWIGNEALRFTNMHRDHRVLETHLPAKRMRVFIKDIEQNFREVKLELDTLWVDLEAGQLTCLWRGLDPVADPMMQDVTWAVIGEESLAEDPLPDEHYRAVLEEFEKDPIGLGDDVLDKQKVFEDEGPTALQKQMEEQAANAAEPSANPMVAQVNQADAMAAAGGAEPTGAGKVVEQALADYANAAGKLDNPAAAARIEQALTDEAAKAAAGGGQHITLTSMVSQALGMTQALTAKGIGGFESFDATMTDPRLAKADPTYAPPSPTPPEGLDKLPDPQPQVKEEWAAQTADQPAPPPPEEPLPPAEGPPPEDHANENFDGQSLRGRDFTNWILTGATFVGADLSGAIFRGAQINLGSFDKATCSGADFSNANFSEASAKGAVFVDATFTGADCRWTRFIDADLTRVKADKADFSYAHLTHAKATQANFQRCEIEKARLQGADFTDANFELARMREAIATGATFTRANFTTARLTAGDFTDASFTTLNGNGSMWHDAILTNARFVEADLLKSFFTGCKGKGCDFASADLKQARMQDSDWQNARFIAANLFKADLARCNLLRATLQDANLYGALLNGASIDQSTSLIGAITTSAQF